MAKTFWDMVRVRYAILLWLGLVSPFLLGAQVYELELGVFLGGSNYMGELQQTRFEHEELNVASGLFIRYHMGKVFSLKAHLYKGEISGTDANYETLHTRTRNLSFRSPVIELGTQLELALIQFDRKGLRMASPYVFVGLSGFYFNPQTYYQGRWVALQPLGTEGQGLELYPERERYPLVQWSIPMGIGFSFRPVPFGSVGFELGFRKTNTDYLDDISGTYPDIEVLAEQNPLAGTLSFRTPELTEGEVTNPAGTFRGDPQTRDYYFFGGITITAIIFREIKSKAVYKKKKSFYF